MNKFKHKSTIVEKSFFDFSKMTDEGIEYSGEVKVAATIGIPKDTKEVQAAICRLDFSLGEEEDLFQIRIKTRSVFMIEGEICEETLKQDVENICYPQAMELLSKKIGELTKIHTGVSLQIPLGE